MNNGAYRDFRDFVGAMATLAVLVDMFNMFPTHGFVDIFIIGQSLLFHRVVLMCLSYPVFMSTPAPTPNGRRSRLTVPMSFNVGFFGVPLILQLLVTLAHHIYEPRRVWVDYLFLFMYTLTCAHVVRVCGEVLELERAKTKVHPKN